MRDGRIGILVATVAVLCLPVGGNRCLTQAETSPEGTQPIGPRDFAQLTRLAPQYRMVPEGEDTTPFVFVAKPHDTHGQVLLERSDRYNP